MSARANQISQAPKSFYLQGYITAGRSDFAWNSCLETRHPRYEPKPLDRSGKIVEQLLLNSRIVGSSNRIL
ncbi:MAG: hypothetical protein DMG61_20410 [Acidobacteria bacterium]|nr:MAG: hypothetical protein DMG61_20410 [Acidobacteriota bacterium]